MALITNLYSALAQGTLLGIMALGVYITFRILDIADLSCDGTFALGGCISAILITRGVNPFVTLLFALVGGMLAGLVTGWLHTKLMIPAILAGILTMIALWSVNIRVMGGPNVSLLGEDTAFTKVMDLRVKAIREALDEAGFVYTPIMSYSAKFASGYYGPFRDAAHSAPGFGDRKTYQMDPANGQEALREIGEDIEEGADLIIAKPALAYMDIMKEASMKYNIPIVAYNVSGEYAMVKAAAANGWIDEKKIVMENMVGLKRAGAKMIITYHALDVAKWLKEEER